MELSDCIESVELRRGPCFGTCPVYRVRLSRAGAAEWEGEAFTDRVGRFSGRVEAEEFTLVASFIERSGFFSWDEDYPPSATCLPDYTLTVATVDLTRRVTVWADSPSPPDFQVIARLVDGIADRINWGKTPEGRRA
jgi:Domain of unknown function (DUF6438)